MLCQACENGDHWNCNCATWCECDCYRLGGIYFRQTGGGMFWMMFRQWFEACGQDFCFPYMLGDSPTEHLRMRGFWYCRCPDELRKRKYQGRSEWDS